MPNSPSGGKQKLVPMNAIFSSPLPSAHVPFPPSSVRTKEEKRRSAPRGHSSAYLWLHSWGRDSPLRINVEAKKVSNTKNWGEVPSSLLYMLSVAASLLNPCFFRRILLLPPPSPLTDRPNERTNEPQEMGKEKRLTPPPPLIFRCLCFSAVRMGDRSGSGRMRK